MSNLREKLIPQVAERQLHLQKRMPANPITDIPFCHPKEQFSMIKRISFNSHLVSHVLQRNTNDFKPSRGQRFFDRKHQSFTAT